MKQKILMLFLGIGSLMAIENPIYKLIDKKGNFEIREYQSMIIAVTQVSLPYRSAQSEGFRRIANYIFGGNDSQMEIAMTAPVISTELDGEEETHEVLFIMPREHQFENLPSPNLKNVKLEERKLSKVAAITFGGWATEERVKYFQDRLEKRMSELGLQINGKSMVAQYNSPWALPPFRKNEILIQID